MFPYPSEPTPPLILAEVETTWRRLHDPSRFALIYGPAIRRYLAVLLDSTDEADDVMQDVMVKMTAGEFSGFDPGIGTQFRNYLKAILRNAARSRLTRRGKSTKQLDSEEWEAIGSMASDPAETLWLEEWRGCLLNQALRALERHERDAKRGNLAYTVLRLCIDHPEADSRELSDLASKRTSRPVTPEAFRKQLSRARQLLAGFLVRGVQETLDGSGKEEVREELAELGLLEYVREYLLPG